MPGRRTPTITLGGSLTATGGDRAGTGSAGSGGQIWLKDAVLLNAAAIAASAQGGSAGVGAGANVRFDGTINSTGGARALTVNTNAATIFGGAVGGTSALASLTTNAGGTTSIGGNVTTTGAQTYNDAVTLTGNAVLTGTTPTFASTVAGGGFDLTLNFSGTTTVNGANFTGIRNLATGNGGATQLTGAITTTGTQTYNDAVTLTGATTLASSGNGAIALNGTVDGAQTLAVNTTGTTTFAGAVGGTTALTSLTTNAGGTTNVGGNVTTTGAQTYNDAVTLTGGGTRTFASTGNNALAFNATVDGASALVANTTGTTTFAGAVGGATALTSLTTNAGGTTAINGGSVRTHRQSDLRRQRVAGCTDDAFDHRKRQHHGKRQRRRQRPFADARCRSGQCGHAECGQRSRYRLGHLGDQRRPERYQCHRPRHLDHRGEPDGYLRRRRDRFGRHLRGGCHDDQRRREQRRHARQRQRFRGQRCGSVGQECPLERHQQPDAGFVDFRHVDRNRRRYGDTGRPTHRERNGRRDRPVGQSFREFGRCERAFRVRLARWLVWSSNPNPFGGATPDNRGGLAYDFKQYNATYGVTPVAQATGNGFLYSLAPTITPGLTGTVSKVYDGNTTATLTAGNFVASGAVDGDTVVLSATGANYDNKNVGTAKTVTATGITASASNGFGHGLWLHGLADDGEREYRRNHAGTADRHLDCCGQYHLRHAGGDRRGEPERGHRQRRRDEHGQHCQPDLQHEQQSQRGQLCAERQQPGRSRRWQLHAHCLHHADQQLHRRRSWR